jgi:hypothetical protein
MLDSRLIYQKCPRCNLLLKILVGISIDRSAELSKEEEIALRLAGQYVDAVCFNCSMQESLEQNREFIRKNRPVGMIDVR